MEEYKREHENFVEQINEQLKSKKEIKHGIFISVSKNGELGLGGINIPAEGVREVLSIINAQENGPQQNVNVRNINIGFLSSFLGAMFAGSLLIFLVQVFKLL